MQQIITLQIIRKDTKPVNEYDWKELLKLEKDESVDVLDYWIIRGTNTPELNKYLD